MKIRLRYLGEAISNVLVLTQPPPHIPLCNSLDTKYERVELKARYPKIVRDVKLVEASPESAECLKR